MRMILICILIWGEVGATSGHKATLILFANWLMVLLLTMLLVNAYYPIGWHTGIAAILLPH